MSVTLNLEDKSASRTIDKRIGIIGGVASILSLILTLLTLSFEIPLWIRLIIIGLTIVGFLVYWFSERSPMTLLWHRIRLTISGASKTDFIFDSLRIIGLTGIVVIPFYEHKTQLFSFQYGLLFFLSLLFVFSHSIYRFIKMPSMWDKSYKLRKGMEATAINYASDALLGSNLQNCINNIEMNALMCAKSYLEYSVMDRDGGNFHVNLIVKDPNDSSKLVCIQRVNPGKGVPKRYDIASMPRSKTALETGKPIYIGDFSSQEDPGKDYKMLWIIPLSFPPDAKEYLGLLAIASTKRKHLNLVDNRESLLFNLTPYIALLRYSILLRKEHNIWY